MSSNRDLVRSIYTAFERGDFSSTEWAHPEIEFERVGPDLDEPVRVVGVAEMVASYRDFLSAWEDLRFKVDEYPELDEERVLVLGHYIGRGKRSGVEIGQITTRMAAVLYVKDSRVSRLVNYWDRDRARADLGLAAEAATLTPAEKLALGQRSYAAFSAGPDIDSVLAVWHPECEWRMGPTDAAFGAESFSGHAGLRAWVAAIEEGWEDFAVEIDEARISGEGVALVRSHARGRSRGTHMELSIPRFWQRSTYRDGLLFSVEQFDEPPPEWDEATPITPEAG
jgi:ketosteroid isomerase-like protein